MFILPAEPQKSLKLFVTCFEFWKSHYSQLLLIVLAAIVLGALPGVLFPQMTLKPFYMALNHRGIFIASAFVYLMIMYWLFAFILHRVYCIMYDKKLSMGYSFLRAFKKLPYLVITLLIYQILSFLGMLLLIVPGIVILVLLAMAFPLVVIDDENPFSAIKKSWQITSPCLWHAFTVLFTLTAGIILVTLSIDAIGMHLYMLDHPAGWGKFPIGHTVLKIAVDIIFFPFYVTTIMMLLHDLKLRRQKEIIETGAAVAATH